MSIGKAFLNVVLYLGGIFMFGIVLGGVASSANIWILAACVFAGATIGASIEYHQQNIHTQHISTYIIAIVLMVVVFMLGFIIGV